MTTETNNWTADKITALKAADLRKIRKFLFITWTGKRAVIRMNDKLSTIKVMARSGSAFETDAVLDGAGYSKIPTVIWNAAGMDDYAPVQLVRKLREQGWVMDWAHKSGMATVRLCDDDGMMLAEVSIHAKDTVAGINTYWRVYRLNDEGKRRWPQVEPEQVQDLVSEAEALEQVRAAVSMASMALGLS